MTGSSRQALIVRGGWPGHRPVEATEEFVPFLQRSGFAVTVEESPAVYADPERMAGVDLIVQCVSMAPVEAEQVAGLEQAVRAGAGLAGWHGGIVDSYRDRTEYLQLVGGQFACHPGRLPQDRVPGEDDNFVPHTVEIVAGDDPIVAGLANFELTTEQYWVLTDSYNQVLATTTQRARPGDPWHRDITSPAVWTRRWGAGRVFVATPGHDLATLRHPSVRTIIERGLLWAARDPSG